MSIIYIKVGHIEWSPIMNKWSPTHIVYIISIWVGQKVFPQDAMIPRRELRLQGWEISLRLQCKIQRGPFGRYDIYTCYIYTYMHIYIVHNTYIYIYTLIYLYIHILKYIYIYVYRIYIYCIYIYDSMCNIEYMLYSIIYICIIYYIYLLYITYVYIYIYILW